MARVAQWGSSVAPTVTTYQAVVQSGGKVAIVYVRVRPDAQWYEIGRLDLRGTTFASAVVAYVKRPVPIKFGG